MLQGFFSGEMNEDECYGTSLTSNVVQIVVFSFSFGFYFGFTIVKEFNPLTNRSAMSAMYESIKRTMNNERSFHLAFGKLHRR